MGASVRQSVVLRSAQVVPDGGDGSQAALADAVRLSGSGVCAHALPHLQLPARGLRGGGHTLIVVRRLLSPRWLALHALAVVMAATCLALGWWQWRRGQAGNARSFAYALEWPTFAIFILFMWGRMIYDELRPPAFRPARPTMAAAATPASDPAPGPVAAVDPDADPELAAYNRYLAELNARAERYRR